MLNATMSAMAEDTRSTSKGAVLSGDTQESQGGFDLRSWQGLTEVLKVARQSGLPDIQYAEFRDLVLQYAQRGGDVALRKKIDAQVALFKKKIQEDKAKIEEEAQINTVKQSKPRDEHAEKLGIRRAQPAFAPVRVRVTEAPLHSEQSNKQEPTNTPAVHDTDEHKKTSKEIPPTPIEVPVASTLSNVVKSVDEYKARITEIKRNVNARVGNPVALIDTRNQVGRVYMSALLTAMKATGPGATMSIEEAMVKLEEAYAAITNNGIPKTVQPIASTVQEQSIPEVSKVESDDKPEPEQIVEHQSEPQPVEQPLITSEASIPVESEPEQVPAPAPVIELAPEPEQIVEHQSEPQPVEQPLITSEAPIALESVLVPEPEAVLEQTQSPVIEPAPEPEVVSGWVSEEPLPQVSENQSREEENKELEISQFTQTPIPKPRRKSISSRLGIPSLLDIETNESSSNIGYRSEDSQEGVLKTEPAKDSEYISAPAPVRVENRERRPLDPTGQTELADSEITVALNQLLHEWSIFESSGLFGMGPGGVDHPLYVTLSRLTMGEVISGRWEHASAKTTHIIKDYVDAWRHEQGVAYNPTETFEHYLRRVVQRIVKRQKGEIIVA